MIDLYYRLFDLPKPETVELSEMVKGNIAIWVDTEEREHMLEFVEAIPCNIDTMVWNKVFSIIMLDIYKRKSPSELLGVK